MAKPFTRAQAARILSVDGKPLLDSTLFGGKRPPLVAESWVQRRLMDWEDRAVLEEARVFQAFQRRIKRRASALAERYGLGKLEATAAGVRWQRALVEAVEADAGRVYEAVAAHAFQTAMTAYYAGYYGRAWVLSEALVEGAPVQAPMPDIERAAERVIIPVLKEAGGKTRQQQQADMVYDLLGRQWRAEFGNQRTALVDGIMRSLNASLAQGQSIPQAMQGVANVMGVNIDRRLGAPTAGRLTRLGLPGPRQYSAGTFRQNFNRVQTITRSYIIESSNAGALELYRANADVLQGVQWSAARDGRVCQDCRGLDGQRWTLYDLMMPRPVVDTHPSCRCSLIPWVKDKMELPDLYAEENPRQSLWDYAGMFAGAMELLAPFKTGAGAPVGTVEDWWNEELEAEFWDF